MFRFLKSMHDKFFNFTTMVGTSIFPPSTAKPVDTGDQNKQQEQNDHVTSSVKEDNVSEKDTTTSSQNNKGDESNNSSLTIIDNTTNASENSGSSSTVSKVDGNATTSTDIVVSSNNGATNIEELSSDKNSEKQVSHDDSKNGPRDYIVSEAVVQKWITLEQCDTADIDLMKDLVVAARLGFLDYSDLKRKGYVDSDGYVLDSDALYESSLLKSGYFGPTSFSNEELAWGQENFEIIRVLEATNGWFQLPYEVNLSLLQHQDSGDYVISLAGTRMTSIGDWFTNLGNTLGLTTPHYKKESQLIDQLFEDDIEEGASVSIVGYSMGGTEAMLQYYRTPDLYDNVYAIQPQGLDGLRGTLYDDFCWDGRGDNKITAIMSDEKGFDFNDIVTKTGHIPAGTVYDVTVDDGNNNGFFGNFVESHILTDVWDAVSYYG